MKALKIIGTILISLAGLFFVCALLSNILLLSAEKKNKNPDLQKEFYKKGSGIETIGKVVKSSMDVPEREFYTVIEYYAAEDDKNHTYTLDYESTALPTGQEVHITYDPKNPSDCVIEEVQHRGKVKLSYGSSLVVAFFVVMGSCYLIVGAILLYIRNKNMQNRDYSSYY